MAKCEAINSGSFISSLTHIMGHFYFYFFIKHQKLCTNSLRRLDGILPKSSFFGFLITLIYCKVTLMSLCDLWESFSFSSSFWKTTETHSNQHLAWKMVLHAFLLYGTHTHRYSSIHWLLFFFSQCQVNEWNTKLKGTLWCKLILNAVLKKKKKNSKRIHTQNRFMIIIITDYGLFVLLTNRMIRVFFFVYCMCDMPNLSNAT